MENNILFVSVTLPIIFGLIGCSPLKQYREVTNECSSNITDADKKCGTQAIQRVETAKGNSYQLGFIEFDDQGQLWDRDKQKKYVIDRINAAAESQDLVMVVFVHGWKHSAAPDDPNINTFRSVLADLADTELIMNKNTKAKPRNIFGVYLGWRGGSINIPFIEDLTFWDRKNTAHKVGHGGVTEVLSDLERIRNRKPKQGNSENRTKLAIIGHSFGGTVLNSALVQLQENRFVTSNDGGTEKLVRGFGDLVVFINPAFEATLFIPLSDMSAETKKYDTNQMPIMVILTSEADWATRYAFPAGRMLSTIFENNRVITRTNATIRKMESIDEYQANTTAAGHFTPYRTHTLNPIVDKEDRKFATQHTDLDTQVQNLLNASESWHNDTPGSKIGFGEVTLERTASSAGRNPYIVAYVDKNLIKDHDDIADPRVVEFIKQLLLLSSHDTEDVNKVREALKLKRSN